MAFLHKDKRGFFYLCESQRTGGRVVRKKLAYLGRLEMPKADNGKNWGHLQSEWWGRTYGNLRNDIPNILRGTLKPTWRFTYSYLEIVAGMFPSNREEEKIIARAKIGWREWCRWQDIDDPMNRNVVPKNS